MTLPLEEDVLGSYLQSRRVKHQGPNLLIFHQEDYRENNLDVEVGTVINETQRPVKLMPGDDLIQIRTLIGSSQMVTGVHLPQSGTRAETYASLAAWTQRNAFHPIGPWRELFYQQEIPQQETVVEVQRPVVTAEEYYAPLEVIKMEPKIIQKEGFTLVGMRYFGSNENREIKELWTRFNQRLAEMNVSPNVTDAAAIGLCTVLDDAPEEDGFEYVAGYPVKRVGAVPEDFVVPGPAPYLRRFHPQGRLAKSGKDL